MLIDNNRLSHWLAVGILIWLAYLAFLGLPIFHWGLNVSITKVVSFFCAAGLLQLAVTPWMFWARATPSDPNRRFGHLYGKIERGGTKDMADRLARFNRMFDAVSGGTARPYLLEHGCAPF